MTFGKMVAGMVQINPIRLVNYQKKLHNIDEKQCFTFIKIVESLF